MVGEGAIARGQGEDAMGTDEGFTSGAFIRMVRRVSADNSIAGVILRVDSPAETRWPPMKCSVRSGC